MHVKFADIYASLIGPPFVSAIVMVFAGADATGTLSSNRERWGRIVERAWAIVIIDVGVSFVQSYGLTTMNAVSDGVALVTGILLTFLAAMLVYAEPFVCLQQEAQTLTIVPFALLRSMMLSWVNISRIFSLFAVQLGAALAIELLHQAAVHFGMKSAWVWVELSVATLLTAPLAALFTVAYLDTLSQEQQTLE